MKTDSAKEFPILYVPAKIRPSLDFVTPQKVPQGINGLPARLPMGDLQPDTFRKTAEGFEVEYRSGDFSMLLKINGDSFYAKELYKNTELLYYMGSVSMFLGPRIMQLRLGPSEEADGRIGSDLEAIGNIKYAPFGDVMKTGSSNSFPDGFLMTIVIPLAITEHVFQHLSCFLNWVRTEAAVTVSGFMEYGMHVVNYCLRRCRDVPEDPLKLFLWSLEKGYLPLALPEIEGDPDNRVITIRRMGYNLVLNVFMRDLFKVVRSLKDACLIGDADAANQEKAVIISNTYNILKASNLSFYTNDLSRHVFYPEIMSDRVDLKTKPLGHDELEQQLKIILSRYQGIVTDIKSDFGV